MINGKLYLKKVIFYVPVSEETRMLAPLIQKLRKRGIGAEIKSGEGESISGAGGEGATGTGEGTLFITDSGKWGSLLVKKKLPVLGWLHEPETAQEAPLPYCMENPAELDVSYLDRVYRRFHNIPWDILETERCLIRETVEEDVDSFYEIYSDPEMVRYTEALYPEIEQEKQYVREYIEKVYRYFEFGVWTVLWKETGEVIGRAGFSVRGGYDLPELGFVIGMPWQRKGIAYEICKAILDYGAAEFGFEKVQVLVEPGNEASLGLCRKLGFDGEQVVTEGNKEYFLLIRQ